MNSKKIFSNRKKLNGTTKNFIIAFAIFIVILGISSVVLFLHSLDFDLNNLVESTTEYEETTTESTEENYSVENLSGSSNIMFTILNDENKIEFVFCTFIDFYNKTFKIKQIDGDAQLSFGEIYKSVNGIYAESSVDGLKSFIQSCYDVKIDKFAMFKKSDFKKFLSNFDGIEIDVTEDVNYQSPEFNLELKAGKQALSSEKAVNYLFVCDKIDREKALCDVISSLLKSQYIKEADILFKKFVNSCKTDISVIDFSDSMETIKVYCFADDKFMPTPYSDGE